MTLAASALTILHEWVQAESLRKHCYAVAVDEAFRRSCAAKMSPGPVRPGSPLHSSQARIASKQQQGAGATQPVRPTGCPSGAERVDFWEAIGVLHDMDYERHPNQEQSATEGHPFVGVAWLRQNEWGNEVCRAILSHADYSGVKRERRSRKLSMRLMS